MWCALELKGQLQKYSPVTKHGSLRQNQIFVSDAQESTLKSTPLTMGVATGGDGGDMSPQFEIPGGMSHRNRDFKRNFYAYLSKFSDIPIFPK